MLMIITNSNTYTIVLDLV